MAFALARSPAVAPPPPSRTPACRSAIVARADARAGAASPRELANKIAKIAATTSLAVLLVSGSVMGPALPALARSPDDTLGLAAEELENLEPVVAEDKKLIEAKLGKKDTKDIIKEIQLLEKKVASLEKKADGAVGAESPELDAAAAPLLARITELRNIVGLVDDNAVAAR